MAKLGLLVRGAWAQYRTPARLVKSCHQYLDAQPVFCGVAGGKLRQGYNERPDNHVFQYDHPDLWVRPPNLRRPPWRAEKFRHE